MGTLSQITTATTGDTLTAAIWNNEFSNIINEFNGSIENANIASDAAIAYSKLNLTGNILNADVNASAAIAYSKLNLTGAILNADLAGSISASKISDTAVTLTASQSLSNKTLTKPTVNASIHTLNNNSYQSTVTFDMDVSSHHKLTLTGNATLAVTNVDNDQAFIIHLIQDGTGSRLVNWFSGIKWSGGSSPTLTTTASKVDSFGFIKDGSDYYGYILGQNI